MNRLTGKVVLVTGASKGIGAEIAKAMAAEGASVIVNYCSSHGSASRVVSEITSAGGKALALQADVSKQKDVERMFAEIKQAFGQLNVLVNNAGVYKFIPIENITVEEFNREYSINVLGPLLTIQEALKQFGFEDGCVINLSSIAGSDSTASALLYSSTKAAVESLTQGLSRELGPKGIRVNAIAPGPTRTEGVEALGFLNEEVGKKMVSATPLARVGAPSDIAKVAVFLASSDAGWITGETIRVAGGLR